MRTVTWK